LILLILFFIVLFFLLGSFVTTALSSAFRGVHPKESEKLLQDSKIYLFFPSLHLFFFGKQPFEAIFFIILCAQTICRYFYAISTYLFLLHTPLFPTSSFKDIATLDALNYFWMVLSALCFITIGCALGDFLPRTFGTKKSESAIRLCLPLATCYLLLAFPIATIFLRLSRSLSYTMHFDYFQEPTTHAKQEIIEMIQKAELAPEMSHLDKQLIESVLTFRKRIAREVMVPRIEMFALSADTTIREAARQIQLEGYSRTPVYKTSVDNIIGIVMYKDITKKYMEYTEQNNDPTILDAPIETITKPTLYTPEMKKISNLLQEFRKKQVHLAIVIDEYGGTEGIVTIEDILEEIVGDISDEYDEEEEELIKQLSNNSWVIDARLSVFDVAEALHISIPQDGEYDTIGGYIYNRAGTIPSTGFAIHHEDFDMEVIRSNERAVEKVRIKKLD